MSSVLLLLDISALTQSLAAKEIPQRLYSQILKLWGAIQVSVYGADQCFNLQF